MKKSNYVITLFLDVPADSFYRRQMEIAAVCDDIKGELSKEGDRCEYWARYESYCANRDERKHCRLIFPVC